MKEALIALDYNPEAQSIAEKGYAVAKTLGYHVTLLHATEEPAYYYATEYPSIMGFSGFNAIDFQHTIEELRNAAQEFLIKAREHLGDTSIGIAVKDGNAADMILETAQEVKAALIIMASHGRKGINKILSGSVAEKVLHHTTIPLLIFPVK